MLKCSGVSPIPCAQSPVPACFGRFSGQPLTPVEIDLLEDIKKSNNKRKLVKQGLAMLLERTIRTRRSMRVIQEHEMSLLNLKPTNFIDLCVSKVEMIGPVVSVQGVQETGTSWTFFIHLEFCSKPVEPGYKIRIHHPWTEIKVEKQNILVGVNEWENITTGEPERTSGSRSKDPTEYGPPPVLVEPEKTRVKPSFFNMLCACQTLEGDDSFCDYPGDFENLMNFEKCSAMSSVLELKSEISFKNLKRGKER